MENTLALHLILLYFNISKTKKWFWVFPTDLPSFLECCTVKKQRTESGGGFRALPGWRWMCWWSSCWRRALPPSTWWSEAAGRPRSTRCGTTASGADLRRLRLRLVLWRCAPATCWTTAAAFVTVFKQKREQTGKEKQKQWAGRKRGGVSVSQFISSQTTDN